MKIDPKIRFPHPVLWAETHDFLAGEFAVKLSITEAIDTGSLRLAYNIVLDESNVRALMESGRARAGVYVTCRETYFNELKPLSLDGGQLEIPGGRLKGRVVLRPLVWSSENISNFRSPNLHPEFGVDGWSFPKGAILALGDETNIDVGREKLAPIESIFTLSRNDEVPENQIRIQLDGEKIAINAPSQTHEKIDRLRGSRAGKIFLLNGIYLPAVMDVLSYLRDDSGIYEGKRWHRIFMAKTGHLGISLENGDILEGAQKLLASPFKRVKHDDDLVHQ